MSLPKVNKLRLQQTVTNLETRKAFKSFEELTFAVAGTSFAEQDDLDAKTIGELILNHEIVINSPKPGEAPKPVAKPTPVAKPEPVTDAKPVATFTEGGKGRKQCPTCNVFVAALSRKCACGHEFVFKPKRQSVEIEDEVDEEVPEEVMPNKAVKKLTPASFKKRTAIPSGECPHKLTGNDKPTITDWGLKVRGVYAARGEFLMLTGLIYFMGYFYDRNRDIKGYTTARDNLESVFSNEYTPDIAETD